MTKTETKSTVLLKHHLKTLKLPTMHNECEKIAQRCAAHSRSHSQAHPQYSPTPRAPIFDRA